MVIMREYAQDGWIMMFKSVTRIAFLFTALALCMPQSADAFSLNEAWKRLRNLPFAFHGTEDAPPEMQQKAREIMRSSGVNNPDQVLVKRMRGNGVLNAAVIGMGPFRNFFIGDKIDELPEKEQEFVLAHEAQHFRHDHWLQMVAIATGASYATGLLINKILRSYHLRKGQKGMPVTRQKGTKGKVARYTYYGAVSLVSVLPALLALKLFGRFMEEEADQGATWIYGAQGGIDLMKRFKQEKLEACSHKAEGSLLSRGWYVLRKMIDPHPSEDERIAYLTRIQELKSDG